MTLEEMAKQLGVSKSTVSRALSGKGRIGQETRRKIIAFAAEHGMHPQAGEKQETGKRNIGVVFPADIYINGNPYFQDCLLGICEMASRMEYNVLLTTGTAGNISGIRKLVEQEKVDGLILTRSLTEDKAVEYLTGRHFPVGMTGLCDSDEVIQVDTDNEAAAENLTSILIGKGFRKFAFAAGDFSYHVNRSRYRGFGSALLKNGLPEEKELVYDGNLKAERLDSVIRNMMSGKAECIICGDDVICTHLMSRMQAEGYRIPKDIAIASLYNSPNLNCFTPQITVVDVKSRLVGSTVAKEMIHYLEGEEYERKVMIDHEILLRKSTNRL